MALAQIIFLCFLAGVTKKLEGCAKKKDGGSIRPWIKSIGNHLYWAAISAGEDGEEKVAKWKSLSNHICNIHEGHSDKFPKCLHGTCDDKEWFEKGSRQHKMVLAVVESPYLLRDIPKLSPFHQTYSLEVFHSVVNHFAPKSTHFFYSSMQARLYVAALHYNENGKKERAVTKEGKEKWQISYPKAKKGSEAVVKPCKIDPTYVIVLCDGKVNSKWQRETLQTTFGKNRYHLHGTGKQEARDFIKKQFTKYGLTVISQTFETVLSNVTGENIIGVLKGKNYNSAEDTFYGIGAHYDTMPDTPGVDDNGSGVVAMLESARMLKEAGQHENTLIFIAFDFEEWLISNGSACTSLSCGSKYFVNNWPAEMNGSLPQTRFGGIIVMDTVMNFEAINSTQNLSLGFKQVFPKVYQQIKTEGFTGDFLAVVSRKFDNKVSGPFAESWNSLANTKLEIEQISLPIGNPPTVDQQYNFGDFFRSDHSQFWLSKMPAIFLTDTADYRGFMHKCYHHECDNVANIDDDNIEFLGKLTDSLVLTLTKLSPVVPSTNGSQHPYRDLTASLMCLLMLKCIQKYLD